MPPEAWTGSADACVTSRISGTSGPCMRPSRWTAVTSSAASGSLASERDGIEIQRAGPAARDDASPANVDRDDEPAGEPIRHRDQPRRLLDRARAEHHARGAEREPACDRLRVAHAATDLDVGEPRREQ